MNLSSHKVRSRFPTDLPEATGGNPEPGPLHRPIPVPSADPNPVSTGVSRKPSESIYSVTSPLRTNFHRLIITSPSLSHSSDEEPPTLSHSWSDSSIEEKDLLSDPEYEFDVASPPPATEKPKVILSDHLVLNSSLPLLPWSSHHSRHNLHHHLNNKDPLFIGSTSVSPISPISPISPENWCRRRGRINVYRSLSELKPRPNHFRPRKPDQSVDRLLPLPQSSDYRKKLLFTGQAAALDRDLMGNKLVKLKKKSLGDLKSYSNYHEDDHLPPLSAYRERKRSPLPTSSAKMTKPFPSFNHEKSRAGPRECASRSTSNTVSSKPDSRTVTSAGALSKYSGSTTRPPTIPSSEALTLRSDSSLPSPPQQPLSQPQPQPQPPLQPPLQPQPSAAPETRPTSLVAGETAFPGPPLNVVQFECYQKHRSMRSSRNKLYPVGCMICHKIDAEMRWRCTWCCLSACEDCNHMLSEIPDKDLRSCLKKLGLRE